MREVEVTSTRPADRCQETRVEDQVESLLRKLQPSPLADKRRSAVFEYVRHVIKKQLPGCEIFAVGSFPLKTYLPCADVDMVMFLPRDVVKSNPAAAADWQSPGVKEKHELPDEDRADSDKAYYEERGASNVRPTPPLVTVNQALCMVATKRGGRRGSDGHSRYLASSDQKSKPEIRNVSFVNARTPMVTMLVGNVVVDLTENQSGSVAASVLLEEADRFIQRDHLFKRSLLLLKAWALCETPRLVGQRVLGAREGGLTSYGLSIMVLHLFGSKQSADTLVHPLDVFIRFFEVFAAFDWSRHCLTLDGPVAFEEVRDYRSSAFRGKGASSSRLWPLIDSVMAHLSTSADKTERIAVPVRRVNKSGRRYDRPGGSTSRAPGAGEVESSFAHFPVRHCNIQDPLNSLNNLGHSVSRRSLKALEDALRQGRELLENCDLMPGADAHKRVSGSDTAGADSIREKCPSPTCYKDGDQEVLPSERDAEDRPARLVLPQQSVPLPAPANVSPIIPRQLFTPIPLARPPALPPLYSGVFVGSGPPMHVAPPHHVDVSVSQQQLRLAQSQALLQLATPMYQVVYHPYVTTERATTAAVATAAIPGSGQAAPHGQMYVPPALLHGHLPRVPYAGVQLELAHGHEQRSVGAADVLVHDHALHPVHQPSQETTRIRIEAGGRAPAQPQPQPPSWNGRVNRMVSNGEQVTPAGTAEKDYPEQGLHRVEREKYLDDDRSGRRTVKPAMLPWNLPAFSTSPTSSTASMSECTEVSKDQDRYLPQENGDDGSAKASPQKALRSSSRLWSAENPTSSSSDEPNRSIDLARRSESGRNGRHGTVGKRPRKIRDSGDGSSGGNDIGTDEGLWENWFLRHFFPQCCQLYGSGDGFREDLLDHPCQHWSSLQRPAASSDEEGVGGDILKGACSEMWNTLETVGRMAHGIPQQTSGEGRDGEGGVGNGRRPKTCEAGQDHSLLESVQVPQIAGCRGEQVEQGEVEKNTGGRSPIPAPAPAPAPDSGNTRQDTWDKESCAVVHSAGLEENGNDRGVHRGRVLDSKRPALEVTAADDETGSTTSEEQREKRRNGSGGKQANKASGNELTTPGPPPPAPPFSPTARLSSVAAWTQTDYSTEPRSTGADVGMQCSLERAVLISRGTQCDHPPQRRISTSVQCTSQLLEQASVSGSKDCLAEFVETTSAGTQCLLPAPTPRATDVGIGTDSLSKHTLDGLFGKGRAEKLVQATSRFDPEESQEVDNPWGTWLITKPRLRRLDSLMTLLPKYLPVTFIAGETQLNREVVSEAIPPHRKKHKRKKNKAGARCVSDSSTAEAVEMNGREDSDTKRRTRPPVVRTRARMTGRGYTRRAWWKVVSSRGIMGWKSRDRVVILCSALFLSLVGVLLAGEGAGAGAGIGSVSGLGKAKTVGMGMRMGMQPPLESLRPREDVKHVAHPPMWVMVGGSLTLGDVMAGRLEDSEGFQWVKNGVVLPGRTSSFLSITGATLEDEGTYTCFPARATGAARHTPLWEEATVRVSEPPLVESQLQTQRLARGEMLAIVATASGVPQPQYQWRRNGVPIPGATRPMLVRHSVTEADMGIYTCDVYNVAGSVQWEEMAVILREDTSTREVRSKRRNMTG